ncbi:hypothetical protein J6590_081107 [Homalodisca vitripennis]|nr:hypothetical protein J6590_081107 [Homalodisca vitripennis]
MEMKFTSSLKLNEIEQVQRLLQDNRLKQRRAWLLSGWVNAERYCPCKQPACSVVGGGSEVSFKPVKC